jgi:hypothetical protein
MKDLPDAETLKNLFDYDPITGAFTLKVDRWGRGGPVSAGAEAGWANRQGYRLVMVKRKVLFIHRLIWVMTHGVQPKHYIDHINGVKDDNRLVNLRECGIGENRMNIGKLASNTSGFKGVCRRTKNPSKNKPWIASATSGGKRRYLGTFKTPEEAYAAYCKFITEAHGEFANFG